MDPAKAAIDALFHIAQTDSGRIKTLAIQGLRDYSNFLSPEQRKEAEDLWMLDLLQNLSETADMPWAQVNAARDILEACSRGFETGYTK